jgi:hypothetical protein
MKETVRGAGRRRAKTANAMEADRAGRLSAAVINTQFVGAGGSSKEYGAAVSLHPWRSTSQVRLIG